MSATGLRSRRGTSKILFYNIPSNTIFWYLRRVRIDRQRLKALCKQQGLSLKELLRRSAVSPTAYYSLARKRELLPRSIRAIASGLGVRPEEILSADSGGGTSGGPPARKTDPGELGETVDRVIRAHPGADRDNVWHTLLLLTETPLSRLKRSLLRGRRIDLH